MQPKDIEQATLAYFMECRGQGQWSKFILILIGEMYRSAGSADAQGFLRLVGSRLHDTLGLAEQPTLEALEATLNEQWRAMDWGWVRLTLQGQGIEITHGAYPVLEASEQWTQSISAVLEGLYESLFQAQGEETRLQVRLVENLSGALVFRCAS
ncbi:hypothetical protein IQ22_01642 [Pseudomonas duriflava]|uniref:Cellulose synthase subunit D n=1 Tax=Pseudomonas duriflava TaxID=459528 RepID=A0A562QG63_9PSED|nr:cellulose synthase [Pseudomonas duriflava]TWI55709.1 hypothetical protein IQ22_01642 [Pseudomonas duriflava]